MSCRRVVGYRAQKWKPLQQWLTATGTGAVEEIGPGTYGAVPGK